MAEQFLRILNGGDRMSRLFDRLDSNSSFHLCLGSTETSDVEGISAAGSTPDSRRLTPAADAEALILGQTKTLDKLPVSPRGVVSPVVITKACLSLTGVSPQVVNCGSFVPPQIPHLAVGNAPAGLISSGISMPLNMVHSLFERGFALGEEVAGLHKSLIIAECVPGGTTTALGVLIALGYSAQTALSGSIPNCNHEMRFALVEAGLRNAGLDSPNSDPFEVVAALGDPMQPFAAGMALAAGRSASVILAGGSQMLAVYALCKALSPQYGIDLDSAEIGIITTKWVAFDQYARIGELSIQIGAPIAASCPDFTISRHSGLRAYEEGNVKEGVGAGAAMALAYQVLRRNGGESHLNASSSSSSSFESSELLLREIDRSYDNMVSDLSAAM